MYVKYIYIYTYIYTIYTYIYIYTICVCVCVCVCVCAVKKYQGEVRRADMKKKHAYKFICLKYVTTRNYFYTYI